MDETYDVVVVGAGLAGLTAAATAAGAGASVLVLDRTGAEPGTGDGGAGTAAHRHRRGSGRPEPGADDGDGGTRANGRRGRRGRTEPGAATARPDAPNRGGRAATDQIGRFRFNRGAHALYRTTPGRAVLRRLGVQVSAHLPPTKGAQGRLGERIGLLPVGAGSLARTTLLGGRDKLKGGKLLAGVRRWRLEGLGGLTAAQWFDQLGVEGTLRSLFEAYTRLTTYVADLDVVSADLVAAQIQAAFTGNVDYLDDGWAALVDGLATAAERRGARLEPSARVHAVVPGGGHSHVELADRRIVARRVVLAVGPPEAAAALLPDAPASWRRTGPPVRTACLDLGLASVAPTGLLLGIDRPLYLSRHAPPGRLAPPGGAVYHTMLYHAHDQDPPPDEARATLEAHCRAAGIEPDRAEEVRYLHRMVTCGALPTPETGGMAGRPGVDTGIEGVLVAGDWVGPTGHLADAALVSGETAGRAAATGPERQSTIHPVRDPAA